MKQVLSTFVGILFLSVAVSEIWHQMSKKTEVDLLEDSVEESLYSEFTDSDADSNSGSEENSVTTDSRPETTPPRSHTLPTHTPLRQLGAEEFEKLTEHVFHQLPKIEALRELPEEALHSTPDLIIHAGMEIGRIESILQNQPEFKREAAHFYSQCSGGYDFPASIRAHCFSNLKKLDHTLAQSVAKTLPEDVYEIARQL